MKKIAIFTICILMCCSIIGCGKIDYHPAQVKTTSEFFPDMRDRGFFSQVDKWNLYLDKRVVVKERKGIAFALGKLEGISENFVDKISQGAEQSYYRFFRVEKSTKAGATHYFALKKTEPLKISTMLKTNLASIPFRQYME